MNSTLTSILATTLTTTLIVTIPMSLSRKAGRESDHIRFTVPPQLCFRASKWAYVLLCLFLLLPVALILGGSLFDKASGTLLEAIGGIFLFLAAGALIQLKTASVTFEDKALMYVMLTKKTRIDYSQIERVYASNGFIVIKLHDGKGVVIQLIFEKPGMLIATIKYFAYKAKTDPLKSGG